MSISVKKVATRVSFALAAAALLVPLSVSPDAGVTQNTACAGEKCCPELGSLCGVDDPQIDYYNPTGASCKEIEFQ